MIKRVHSVVAVVGLALLAGAAWDAADQNHDGVASSDEALAWFKRAREIDPYFDQPWYWRQSGITCMVLGRYEEALKLLSRHTIRKYYISAYVAGCHARLPADRCPRRAPARLSALTRCRRRGCTPSRARSAEATAAPTRCVSMAPG